MSYRLITPPAELPVTKEEVKGEARVLTTEEDAIIDVHIRAAISFIEAYTGRSLITQTWELVLDDFSDTMKIDQHGPVQSVTSVTYFDANGDEQTVGSSNYALDASGEPAWLVRASDFSWPTVASGINNVAVRFVAGFADDAASWPEAQQSLRHAVIILARWFFERPTEEIPPVVYALAGLFRVMVL